MLIVISSDAIENGSCAYSCWSHICSVSDVKELDRYVQATEVSARSLTRLGCLHGMEFTEISVRSVCCDEISFTEALKAALALSAMVRDPFEQHAEGFFQSCTRERSSSLAPLMLMARNLLLGQGRKESEIKFGSRA